VIVATLALFIPILESVGINLNSPVTTPVGISYNLLGYIFVWSLAVIVGCVRKHENEIWCLVDSFGIPGIVAIAVGFRAAWH
jgi:hypothetical protein